MRPTTRSLALSRPLRNISRSHGWVRTSRDAQALPYARANFEGRRPAFERERGFEMSLIDVFNTEEAARRALAPCACSPQRVASAELGSGGQVGRLNLALLAVAVTLDVVLSDYEAPSAKKQTRTRTTRPNLICGSPNAAPPLVARAPLCVELSMRGDLRKRLTAHPEPCSLRRQLETPAESLERHQQLEAGLWVWCAQFSSGC
jgi:hypothetical protein